MSDWHSNEDSFGEDEDDAVVFLDDTANDDEETTESESEADEDNMSAADASSDGRNSPGARDHVEQTQGHMLEVLDVAANIDVRTTSVPRGAPVAAKPADTSLSDFKSPKKENLLNHKDDSRDSGDDAETCSICFEPWTNTSSHRLASLKCGHLFGKSCILKWLKGHPGKCPQCNAKADRRDIRVLFVRSVKAVDTSERDQALKELELEKEARKKAELEAAMSRLRYQMALAECNQLKKELDQQRQQLEMLRRMPLNSCLDGVASQNSQPDSQVSTSGRYVFEKHVKIWETGSCRVMAYASAMTTLCVSQPSSIPLFPGFGIKKINCLDFKSTQYVSIHSKPIRDLSFNSRNPDCVLLSCSVDKTIKMSSLISNQVIHSYECPSPVWSCTWNLDDKNYFYAGQQSGIVNVFDVRNLSQPVAQLEVEESRSPVVSLQYLPRTTGTKLRPGGVLVGHLNRSEFYERTPRDDHKLHLLPLEANLTSLSLEENTGHLLATYRPTNKHPHIRHQVSELLMEPIAMSDEEQSMVCSCNVIHTFHGGSTQKLLTRNRIILHPENEHDLLACTGDEATQSFQIWNTTSGCLVQKAMTSDSVLDLCPVTLNDQSFLIALTDKQISVFRYCSTPT